MRKHEDSELQKHTLNLYAGDMDRLQSLFPEIAASLVIRKIVRQYIERMETTKVETPTVEIPGI